MLAAILLLLALVGVLFGALLWRAEPSRWDNRFFALTLLGDAATTATRSLFLLAGYDIVHPDSLCCGMIFGFFVGYTSVEFAHAFPTGRRLPLPMRLFVGLASLAGAVLSLHPQTRPLAIQHANLAYFVPVFLLSVALLVRNYRATSRALELAGIRLVIFAFVFRWFSAVFCFFVAKRYSRELFHAALQFEATASIFIGYLVMGYGVLRYHLFSVRGVLAEMVVYAGFVVSTLGLLVLGIDLALVRMSSGVAQRAVLVLIALLPVGVLALGRWLKPRVEQAIIDPIDPRRALTKNVLSRALGEQISLDDGALGLPDALVTRARTALAEIAAGGKVAFARAAAFPGSEGGALSTALAEHLASSPSVHLDWRRSQPSSCAAVATDLDALGADLVVPVRRAGQLFGAFVLAGGQLDRETVQAAVAIADNLALKLDNVRLGSQMLALESKLEETRRLAALGSFAAAIAHDIRTPLTSIQMNIQMLRRKANLPPDDMESFDIALDELKRLNSNVAELLDYAKPVNLAASPVELATVADEAARSVLPIFEERSLSLERDHEEELPFVLADPTRIRQVLINLLDNAAQASTPGSAVKLRTRRTEEGRVALEVCDAGRGIAPEHLPRIFDPFFTTRADGTGLGLSIARKLIRAHGGDIQVESQPGQGATFRVTLPAAA